MHGGGNTSVKCKTKDYFGNSIDVLNIKGSGWDLGNIEAEGLPAVRLRELLNLLNLDKLTDEEMVNAQRNNLLNSSSPTPSVETLLHAVIPYKFVDHTHSDAIMNVTNRPDGLKFCKKIFGKNVATNHQ